MSWIMGLSGDGNAAADHKDFSDKLVAAATGSSIDSIAVGAAGTGYVAGDVLTLSAGTFTIAGQVEVLTVGGSGEVLTVRRYNDGVYSVTPGTSATTGGTGSSCTITATIASNGWVASRNSTLGVASVDSVAAGGTGYVLGDLITLAGGTTTAPAILEVTGVSTGAVTAATVYDAGSYTTAPGDPVAQASVQPTGGSGATFNLTFTAAAGRREVVLEGSGGGSDEIFVGWRTFEDVSGGYYNLELHGFTGYLGALPFLEQPGMSQGEWDATLGSDNRSGSYLISYPVSHEYFLSITPYRITIKTKLTGRYFDSYLGWGNRFATAAEMPYPVIVGGCTSWAEQSYLTSQQVSGMVDPWRSQDPDSDSDGPLFVYMPDGTWYNVWNCTIGGSSRGAQNFRVMVPTGEPGGATSSPEEDKFMTELYEFKDLIPDSGLSTTPQAQLYATGDTDVRVLFPTMIVFTDPSTQVVAELDGVFWVHAQGGVTSEDRIIVGSDVYRVFQSGNRSDVFGYMAIKEG